MSDFFVWIGGVILGFVCGYVSHVAYLDAAAREAEQQRNAKPFRRELWRDGLDPYAMDRDDPADWWKHGEVSR